jgi:hypothetical protein
VARREFMIIFSQTLLNMYQSYEVIGGQGTPSVGVPTHFAKVILASTSKTPLPLPQPGQGDVTELGLRLANQAVALGAFVLPNAVIRDETPLRMFEVPGEPKPFSLTNEISTHDYFLLQWRL